MLGRHGSGTTVLAGLLYGAIGVGTAALSRTADSSAGAIGWRYVAWAASAAVFLWHLIAARRWRTTPVAAAVQVAIGVALGALLLAVLGPVRAHWAEPSRSRMILLSVFAWPLLTGLPAFVVAVGAEYFLARSSRAT